MKAIIALFLSLNAVAHDEAAVTYINKNIDDIASILVVQENRIDLLVARVQELEKKVAELKKGKKK